MNFSVIEQQTMKDGGFAVIQPIPTFDNPALTDAERYHQAMSRYHMALGSAHLSTACSKISVAMMGSNGAIYSTETVEFEEE